MKKIINLTLIVTMMLGLVVLTGCDKNANGGNTAKKKNTTDISYTHGKGTITLSVPKNEDGTAKYELHISNSDDEFGGSRLPIKKTAIPLTKKDFDENFKKLYDAEKIVRGEKDTVADTAKPAEAEEKPKRRSVIG